MEERDVESVRQQVAAVMKRAELILGTRALLAERLGTTVGQVGVWVAGKAYCPNETVDKAVKVILEHLNDGSA